MTSSLLAGSLVPKSQVRPCRTDEESHVGPSVLFTYEAVQSSCVVEVCDGEYMSAESGYVSADLVKSILKVGKHDHHTASGD